MSEERGQRQPTRTAKVGLRLEGGGRVGRAQVLYSLKAEILNPINTHSLKRSLHLGTG